MTLTRRLINNGLALARHATGNLLEATAELWRLDKNHASYGQLDQLTGEIMRPRTRIWAGRCSIYTDLDPDRATEYGHADTVSEDWRGRFPSTVSARIGDLIVVTSSAADPTVAGAEALVVGVNGGSFKVSTLVTLLRRDRVPAGEWARRTEETA